MLQTVSVSDAVVTMVSRLSPLVTTLVITYITILIGHQSSSTSVYLYGSSSAHLVYPPWHLCPNSSLSFEFRTLHPEGLLMYADDGGRGVFVVVAFNTSAVTARVNLVVVPGGPGGGSPVVASRRRDRRSRTITVNQQVFICALFVSKNINTKFDNWLCLSHH